MQMPKNEPRTAAPPSVNPDLRAVHTELIAIARELDLAVGNAQTSAQVNAILDELLEVNSRVTAVGRQLFTQQSQRIRTASEAVLAATADAEKAVQQLDDVKTFVQGITKFLSLVDKLIDISKVVV
jgi:hypothetical protein